MFVWTTKKLICPTNVQIVTWALAKDAPWKE